MTYKQIEQARETRLWIGQIIVPVIGIALAVPESREWVVQKVQDAKTKAQSWIEKVKKRRSP